MSKHTTCTICQTEITQFYCPNCGQKISGSDATLKSLITDFLSNLFSLDKSVFAGILKIISNPKEMVVNYWRGHRKYYPSPGKLLVYALAIAALHLTYVNTQLLGLSFEFEGSSAQFVFWVIFFPFLTLTSYISFFRKKFSLAKHVISIAYIASCFFMIGTVINDILLQMSIDIETKTFLVFVLVVFIWNAIVFIPNRNIIKIILYTLLQFLVFCSLIGLLVGLIYLIASDSIRL